MSLRGEAQRRAAMLAMRWIAPLAWILALSFTSWLAAAAYCSFHATPQVAALAFHETDPVSAAEGILRIAGTGGRPGPSSASSATARPPLSLHGLATGFGDAGGFALFKTADGSVKTIRAGGTSSDGWRLASIHPDHVILEREGASVRLDLAARQHLTAEQGE